MTRRASVNPSGVPRPSAGDGGTRARKGGVTRARRRTNGAIEFSTARAKVAAVARRHDKKRAKRERHHTPLQKHQRNRKKLVTPFNQLPNLRAARWIPNLLPELLYAASMLDAYDGDFDPAWLFLDALDPFVDEGKFIDDTSPASL